MSKDHQNKKPKHDSATKTVTLFEFYNYLSSKSFIFTTLITVLLIGLSLNFPFLYSVIKGSTGPSQIKEIYIVDESGLLDSIEEFKEVVDPAKYRIQEADPAEHEEYRKMALEENVFGLFVISEATKYEWITQRKPFNVDLERDLEKVATKVLKAKLLDERGLSHEEIDLALCSCELTLTELVEESGKSQFQTMPYTYILIILLYMFLLSYGQMTATSVASEKSSRTMEILITSTHPRHLICGKVFGAGLAGLFQMAVFGAAYYFFFSLSKLSGMQLSILTGVLDMPITIFLMAVAIFLLTYLSFAFLFGAVGSLVNRTEEISQVITPVMTLIFIIFFSSIAAIFDPDKSWVTIASFLPLIGTLIYFVRFSMLELPIWQTVVAALIHTGTIFVCAKIAIVIYRNGVLRYGKLPKLKDLLNLFKRSEKPV
ncbi:MAG: ABC transporter permease [Eubacteriales bacterium]|nr:ABC transporter permease [Eubacteriales bacterium]